MKQLNLDNFKLASGEIINLIIDYEVLDPVQNNKINDYGFPMPSHQEPYIAIVNITPKIVLTASDRDNIIYEIKAQEKKC